ncbi:MAG: hypothetical protein CVV42_07475 [Candidatus Riflebacteria bacterium HGW-Riflebacteria-2]|jgi:ABC-type transport system involved in multi-copper enzyme maturation permease subunit|nr:MAG: hypothetical protein CVV42_07475 [Candidatus Riflebacteria bacterium HGW-Riflebacteria-2]
MYFLIILAVAVVSLLLAAWFKQLDAGVAMFLLFGMQGPLFIYLAAHHQISSEVNNRTFPFLLSLPLSRGRLWLAKLLFVILYAVLLYAVYAVLALICGASQDDFIKLFKINPVLGVAMPLVIVSYGYFTSMLPRGFATVSALIIGPVAFAIATSVTTVLTINYSLLAIFLISIFLLLSFLLFMHDRTMNSSMRGVKGIALLIAAVTALLGCWSTINAVAENYWVMQEVSNSAWVPLNDGRQILWRVESEPKWWDVVDTERHYSKRLLVQDLTLGEVKSLGKRLSSISGYEHIFNEGFVSVTSARYFSGFLRSFEKTIFDHDGNQLVKLPWPSNEDESYLKLIDGRRFIYTEKIKNGPSEITEFNLYEKGRGNKVVFSVQKGFGFSEFIVMPSAHASQPASVYICGKTSEDRNKLTLISVNDGTRHVLPVDPSANSVAACSDFIVFETTDWNKARDVASYTLTLAWLDGRTEHLDWINERLEIAGITADGRIIAMRYEPGDKAYYNEIKQSLVEIDIASKSLKELYRLPKPGSLTVIFTQNRDSAFLYSNSHNVEPIICQYMAINFGSGEIREFENLNNQSDGKSRIGLNLYDAFHLSGSRFMVEAGSSIYELDVSNMQIVKRTSYEALYNRMTKGGGRS